MSTWGKTVSFPDPLFFFPHFWRLVCLVPFPEQLLHYIHLNATFQSRVWRHSDDIKCTFGLVACLLSYWWWVFVCEEFHARESALESTWISQMVGKINALLKRSSQPLAQVFSLEWKTWQYEILTCYFWSSQQVLNLESLCAIRHDRNIVCPD